MRQWGVCLMDMCPSCLMARARAGISNKLAHIRFEWSGAASTLSSVAVIEQSLRSLRHPAQSGREVVLEDYSGVAIHRCAATHVSSMVLHQLTR
jgi:hypothetical protein